MASPHAVRDSILATLAEAESVGGMDPDNIEVMRRVLVPFAEIFADRAGSGRRSAAIGASVTAAAAITSHLLLNFPPAPGVTVAMALDGLLAKVREHALASLEMGDVVVVKEALQ